MSDDATWMRNRMIDVLRSDPGRDISDERTIRELCDFVCGDVVLFRERIARLETALTTAEQQRDKVQRWYDEHILACTKEQRGD